MSAAGNAAKEAGQRISTLLASWGFWAVVFVVGFGAWFYFKGRSKGKQKATEELKKDLRVEVDPKYLTDKNGNKFDPKPTTDRLYKDIKGLTIVSAQRDTEAYNILLAMSDDRVKAVANDWLERYFDETKQTLRKAIEDEHGIAYGNILNVFAWGSADKFSEVQKAVVAKLTNLGIQ